MALIKRFCFCCNNRVGAMASGIYSLITSSIFMALILLRYIGFNYVDTSTRHAIVVYSTFGFFGVFIFFSFALVLAVYKDRKWLYIPWLIISVLAMCQATGCLSWLLIIEIKLKGYVEFWEIAIMTFHLVNFAFTSYCIVCVFSQFQDLINGKGTARYYRRRERRRNQVTQVATVSDQMTSMPVAPPAYMEGPPPYTPHPPMHETTLDGCISRESQSQSMNIDDASNSSGSNGIYEEIQSVTTSLSARNLAQTHRTANIGPPPSYDTHMRRHNRALARAQQRHSLDLANSEDYLEDCDTLERRRSLPCPPPPPYSEHPEPHHPATIALEPRDHISTTFLASSFQIL